MSASPAGNTIHHYEYLTSDGSITGKEQCPPRIPNVNVASALALFDLFFPACTLVVKTNIEIWGSGADALRNSMKTHISRGTVLLNLFRQP